MREDRMADIDMTAGPSEPYLSSSDDEGGEEQPPSDINDPFDGVTVLYLVEIRMNVLVACPEFKDSVVSIILGMLTAVPIKSAHALVIDFYITPVDSTECVNKGIPVRMFVLIEAGQDYVDILKGMMVIKISKNLKVAISSQNNVFQDPELLPLFFTVMKTNDSNTNTYTANHNIVDAWASQFETAFFRMASADASGQNIWLEVEQIITQDYITHPAFIDADEQLIRDYMGVHYTQSPLVSLELKHPASIRNNINTVLTDVIEFKLRTLIYAEHTISDVLLGKAFVPKTILLHIKDELSDDDIVDDTIRMFKQMQVADMIACYLIQTGLFQIHPFIPSDINKLNRRKGDTPMLHEATTMERSRDALLAAGQNTLRVNTRSASDGCEFYNIINIVSSLASNKDGVFPLASLYALFAGKPIDSHRQQDHVQSCQYVNNIVPFLLGLMSAADLTESMNALYVIVAPSCSGKSQIVSFVSKIFNKKFHDCTIAGPASVKQYTSTGLAPIIADESIKTVLHAAGSGNASLTVFLSMTGGGVDISPHSAQQATSSSRNTSTKRLPRFAIIAVNTSAYGDVSSVDNELANRISYWSFETIYGRLRFPSLTETYQASCFNVMNLVTIWIHRWFPKVVHLWEHNIFINGAMPDMVDFIRRHFVLDLASSERSGRVPIIRSAQKLGIAITYIHIIEIVLSVLAEPDILLYIRDAIQANRRPTINENRKFMAAIMEKITAEYIARGQCVSTNAVLTVMTSQPRIAILNRNRAHIGLFDTAESKAYEATLRHKLTEFQDMAVRENYPMTFMLDVADLITRVGNDTININGDVVQRWALSHPTKSTKAGIKAEKAYRAVFDCTHNHLGSYALDTSGASYKTYETRVYKVSSDMKPINHYIIRPGDINPRAGLDWQCNDPHWCIRNLFSAKDIETLLKYDTGDMVLSYFWNKTMMVLRGAARKPPSIRYLPIMQKFSVRCHTNIITAPRVPESLLRQWDTTISAPVITFDENLINSVIEDIDVTVNKISPSIARDLNLSQPKRRHIDPEPESNPFDSFFTDQDH